MGRKLGRHVSERHERPAPSVASGPFRAHQEYDRIDIALKKARF
jgi:hypothetical protein